MRAPAASSAALSLRDLGTLVTVQYPDRADLALIAALRLLSMSGPTPDIRAAYVRGALLTRRARNQVRSGAPASPATDDPANGVLLCGDQAPGIVIEGPDELLDVFGTYRLAELDLPPRLLLGGHYRSSASPDHTLVDFPFGLTGVYRVEQFDSPLAASYRLLSKLGPLTRRRLENDLPQLESSWRQLRDTA